MYFCERFTHAKQRNVYQHTPARLTSSRTRPWTSDPFATEPSGTAASACEPRPRRRRRCRQTATRRLKPSATAPRGAARICGRSPTCFCPTLFDVVFDRFHEVVPQCPSLAVDLRHRLDVHVGSRFVCASRWRELGHACHATARQWRTVVQTCNGGTDFVFALGFAAYPVSSTRGEDRPETRGGAA